MKIRCDVCKRKIHGQLFNVKYIDSSQLEHILGVCRCCYRKLEIKVHDYYRKTDYFSK